MQTPTHSPMSTVVVTGASTGCGFHASRLLAAESSIAKIIVTARTAEKGEEAVAKLNGQTTREGLYAYQVLELGDASSVVAAASALPKVDAIILKSDGLQRCLKRQAVIARQDACYVKWRAHR